jgi:hypothetical protein
LQSSVNTTVTGTNKNFTLSKSTTFTCPNGRHTVQYNINDTPWHSIATTVNANAIEQWTWVWGNTASSAARN